MPKLRRMLLALVSGLSLAAMLGSPASAAVDDGFSVHTWVGYGNKCPDRLVPAGYAYFIDYGEGGLSDPAKNDDYITIRDTCGDGDGVRAYAWLNNIYLGSRYNGLGYDEFVVWDPFPSGNVAPGDMIEIEVCSANGSGDAGYGCVLIRETSVDG